jgi:hypothetical protein
MVRPGDPRPASDAPEHWQTVRRILNAHRHELAALAVRRYPAALRVAGTPLLCRQEWIPDRPVDLEEVELSWADQPPSPAVGGSEPASAWVRPLSASGRRYPSYADALRAIDPPGLFENRACYRLLAASVADQPSTMRLAGARTSTA